MTASTTEAPAVDVPANLAAVWEALAIPVEKLPTIQQIMAAVKQEVGPVAKTERNQQQKFNYRGIDNVVNAAAPALDRYGVLTIPELLESDHSTVEVGNNRTVMGYSRVKVRYHFQGPRGDEIAAVVPGEAMDSGDKAVSKAMSVAYRIALLQSLNLPTGDPDPDSETYERSSGPERDESWRDQPPVNRPGTGNGHQANGSNGHRPNGSNGQQPQRPAAPAAPPPLADGDEWKDRISEVASSDEANMLHSEIVQLHTAGTIDNNRRRLLEAHLRWHMNHRAVNPQPDQSASRSEPAQPEQAAEPPAPAAQHPSGQDPAAGGEPDPWAAQGESFDPMTESAPPPDNGADAAWIAGIRQVLADAQTADALTGIQQQITQKITTKAITPVVGGQLTKELQAARRRVTQMAGATK